MVRYALLPSLFVLPLLAGGCEQAGSDNAQDMLSAAPASNGMVVDTANAAAANALAAVEGPLLVHRGRYPSDVVNGMPFDSHPLVRSAVARALGRTPDLSARAILADVGPATPITLIDGRLVSWRCEQHNCGAHHWTLILAPDGTRPELCYHDEAGDPDTRWLVDGQVTARTDPCPSGDARPT